MKGTQRRSLQPAVHAAYLSSPQYSFPSLRFCCWMFPEYSHRVLYKAALPPWHIPHPAAHYHFWHTGRARHQSRDSQGLLAFDIKYDTHCWPSGMEAGSWQHTHWESLKPPFDKVHDSYKGKRQRGRNTVQLECSWMCCIHSADCSYSYCLICVLMEDRSYRDLDTGTTYL